jgi:APA family basic amino acid/polyamine antiporter
VRAGGQGWLVPAVRCGATLAAVGSLLALVLGVSRTVLAMARDGHLPRALDRVHPVHRVPHRAELAVGALVAAMVTAGDLRPAIGFSAVCVLAYYAIANASAWTLDQSPTRRIVPAAGVVGCVAVGASLPAGSVVAGVAVLVAGAASWLVRRRAGAGSRT